MIRKKISTTGGISQQPNSLRLSNQVTSADNFYVNHLLQTVRRKGIKHIVEASNGSTVTSNDQYYVWKIRGGKYLVCVTEAADGGGGHTGRVRVWNLSTGTQVNVIRTPSTFDYTIPSTGTRRDNIKLIPDGEDLWILNKTKNPVLKADLSTGTTGAYYIFLKQGNYNCDYKIKVKYTYAGTDYEAISLVKTWSGQNITTGTDTFPQQGYDGINFGYGPSQPSQGLLGSIKTEDIIKQLKYNLESEICYLSNSLGAIDSIDILDPGEFTSGSSIIITATRASDGTSIPIGTGTILGSKVVSTSISGSGNSFLFTTGQEAYRLAYLDIPVGTISPNHKPVGYPVLGFTGIINSGITLDNGTLTAMPSNSPVGGQTSYLYCRVVPYYGASTPTTPAQLRVLVNGNRQITRFQNPFVSGTGYYNRVATGVTGTYTCTRVPQFGVTLKNPRIKITQLGSISGTASTNSYLNSILKLEPESGVTIKSVETSDSVGNAVLETIGPKVPRVQGYLPEQFENGVVVEVIGDGDSSADNYFVKFQTNSGETYGEGNWVETLKSGEKYKLDETTMPHKLSWNSSGTLTYDVATWSNRQVGELSTTPLPSIVFDPSNLAAEPIRDMAVYKDRLCFINKKSIVMSETAEHTNIFRSTLLQLLDSDPIDLDLATNGRLNSLVPFSIGLLVFTDNDQTVIRGSDVLSPRTVEVQVISKWDNLHGNNISPIDSGNSLFFLTANGSYVGAREFGLNEQGLPLTKEISSAVPNLIPSTPLYITASSEVGVFAVLSSNKLYIYRYYGDKLVAWFTWSFSAYQTITNISIVDNLLYVTYINNSKLCMGYIDLTEESSIVRYFDKYIYLSGGVYTAGEDTTAYNLTLQAAATSFASSETLGAYDIENNVFYDVQKITTTSIKLSGNTTAKTMIFGVAYASTMELTKPYFSEDINQSLRGINIYYNNTNQAIVSYSAGSRLGVNYYIAQPTSSETTTVALKTAEEFIPITGDPSKAVIQLRQLGYGHPLGIEVIEYLYIAKRSG